MIFVQFSHRKPFRDPEDRKTSLRILFVFLELIQDDNVNYEAQLLQEHLLRGADLQRSVSDHRVPQASNP